MFLLFITAVVVVPLIELYVVVQVGQQIGLLPTIALLIIISAVGTSVAKREGLRVWRAFSSAVARGEVPSREIAHGVCILVAGVFLLAPGFFTDVLGLILLFPPTRAAIVSMVLARTRTRVTVVRSTRGSPRVDVQGQLTTWDVIDVSPPEGDDRERGSKGDSGN